MVWELALHALRHRPLRTILTAAGIAVAVGSMVVFLSLGEGLRRAFAQELGSIGAELQVSYGPFEEAAFGSVPELPLDLVDDVREAGEAYGVQKITPVLLYVRGGFTPGTSFAFQGLPAGADVAAIYPGYEVVEGRGLTEDDADAFVAVVGRQAAERSRLELGDELRLNPQARFEIVGLASSGGGFLSNAILVPLAPLQEAIGVEDRVTFFVIDLAEPGRAQEAAEALSERFPDLGVQTASDVLDVIERGLRISDVVRLGISAIALIVGAIAVANTVLMSVFERTREFGVVRAVGARPRFLFAVVLAESVLLSIVGGAAGVVLGRFGAFAVNRISIDLIGLDVAAVTPRLIAFALAVAIGMGLLSGLAPSARAARIQIADAVRIGG